MERRIVRIDGAGMTVVRAGRFESERKLHDAIAAHPEVLPHEDFGLGPLVTLATELDLGSGPMDLLAADPAGQLVIVEFKRGTENPDVRHVVAQILDYGSSLWRFGYDHLEKNCLRRASASVPSLSGLAAHHLAALGHDFDEDGFRAGVGRCLEVGDFVFVYCGRDLDDRTRGIMTYLAEGPQMRFFAVEVDYFREEASESAVLVPRASFIPSWIAVPSSEERTVRHRSSDRQTDYDPAPFVALLRKSRGQPDAQIVERLIAWAQQKQGSLSEAGHADACLDRLPWRPEDRGAKLWFQLDWAGGLQWLFAVSADGMIELQFMYMADPFRDEVARQGVADRINAIPGLDAQVRPSGRPTFPLAGLADEAAWAAFTGVWTDVIDKTLKQRDEAASELT